jgi:hypothetical protein
VRVINGDQLDANTPQTGVFRQAAINHARVGVQKIWAGTVSIAPDACAKAVGRATPKAIRRRPAAVGKKVTARNVAMMTMSDRAVQAGETTNIEAVRGMMRIVVMKAGAVPMMTTTVARLRAPADMAAGRATPRAIPKRRAAVGKTVGNRNPAPLSVSKIRPWLRPGALMENP